MAESAPTSADNSDRQSQVTTISCRNTILLNSRRQSTYGDFYQLRPRETQGGLAALDGQDQNLDPSPLLVALEPQVLLEFLPLQQ